MRTITAQTLETYGYRVVTAVDGADALSIYAPHMAEIAVALVDMMMPVMDGSSVMQVLRRMNPRLPMVVASGLSTDAQAARAASLGVEHFLAKPYTASALLTVLRRVLDGAAAP